MANAHSLPNLTRRMVKMAPPQTPESIAAAKAQQQADRQQVTDATGVRFVGDEMVRPPHRVACGLCWYTAVAVREGQAINSVAAHIIRVHLKKGAR